MQAHSSFFCIPVRTFKAGFETKSVRELMNAERAAVMLLRRWDKVTFLQPTIPLGQSSSSCGLRCDWERSTSPCKGERGSHCKSKVTKDECRGESCSGVASFRVELDRGVLHDHHTNPSPKLNRTGKGRAGIVRELCNHSEIRLRMR